MVYFYIIKIFIELYDSIFVQNIYCVVNILLNDVVEPSVITTLCYSDLAFGMEIRSAG